ncbi:MAG: histidine phosphatase family protein [Pseudomonadota bacterium]
MTESRTSLVLIRHGPTAWNAQGRMQGRSDQPLSEEGRRAVSGWRIRQDINFPHWRVSPLSRARQTAALLGHAEAVVDPCLVEMDWGAWEGLVLSQLRQRNRAQMAAEEAKGLDLMPPGGESPRQVQSRLAPFLRDIGSAGLPSVAVTHKGVIRALFAQASGWPMLGKAPVKLENACAHLFSVGPSGDILAEEMNIAL